MQGKETWTESAGENGTVTVWGLHLVFDAVPALETVVETDEILRYKRFFASMMLSWLVQEKPVDWVAQRFGVPRGSLQNLMSAAATFANLVSNFCQQLSRG